MIENAEISCCIEFVRKQQKMYFIRNREIVKVFKNNRNVQVKENFLGKASSFSH